MSSTFATLSEEDGVAFATVDVNGFTLAELRFPPGYVQRPVEPDLPYLALVLGGDVQKSFAGHTVDLGASASVTMPAGAAHGARFGANGARIVIVKAREGRGPVADCMRSVSRLHGRGWSWLGWRLAGELRAADAGAPLAAEGLALELLAAVRRDGAGMRRTAGSPPWLRAAEELLRERSGECVRLGELASAVATHPAHLARAFRARHGVSVGEYGRRLRVARAARELARGDSPLAVIAAECGFADQGHFTRLFRRYVGTTPAQYRRAFNESRRAFKT